MLETWELSQLTSSIYRNPLSQLNLIVLIFRKQTTNNKDQQNRETVTWLNLLARELNISLFAKFY